jgi:CheY-like chemotaxis protein
VDLSLEAEEGVAVVAVSDSGIGFESAAMDHMFEPFQGTGARDGRDGLGLGLAIVQEISDRHDATIGGASKGPNRGATFTMRLPRIDAPAPQTADTEGTRRRRLRRRILVIDDNESFLESLADVLTAWGHDVLTAADGPGGIETALAASLDIILCDIDLSDEMDGYLVARKLRSLDATKDACLVAVTGFGQDADRERALNSGFDAHLVKPVDFDELGRLLAELEPGDCEEGSDDDDSVGMTVED